MVTFPTVEWLQQDPSIDPSGFRHLKLGIHGFIKNLDTSAGGVLDFGQVNTTGSGAISSTALIYARVSSFGDASGIYFMRAFWNNISAFTAGTYRFLEQKSLHFVPNLTLLSNANNTPTIVPIAANFSGTITPGWAAGSPWISGIADTDASMYLWLALEIGNSVPVGLKGGAGAGSFRFRLLYDFS
jgi:hypothetical protein